MPISDEALQNEKNRFIAVKGEATVGQALAALNGLGGQPWWHVVARMSDGSWGVARFGELAAALESSAGNADLELHDLNQLRPASVAERGSLETKAAQSLARTSPARVLVVTDDGSPVGILVEGVRRGGDAARLASASLDQIGGKPVKLKDYSSILLGSSKK
jgi:hypothetical protein